MALLKISSLSLFTLSLGGCGILGDTVDFEQKLESDTDISSGNSRNHSAEPELRISKAAALEERALLRLPTSDENGNTSIDLDDAFDDDFDFFMLNSITQTALYGCPAETIITPENLQNSVLEIDVTENTEGPLTGKLEAVLVAKPWWQTVDWTNAHGFTSKGEWSAAGGDVDATYAAIVPTVSGTTLSFNLTAYLKELMVKDKPYHYGFLVRATGATMNLVKLASVQHSNEALTPRLISTYDATGCRQNYESGGTSSFVRYLGR